MAVRATLDRVRLIDLAWNERGWTQYAAHFSDDLVEYTSGSLVPVNKEEHLAQAKRFCETFPDNQLQINPYVMLFSSYDGNQTCALGRLTGTAPAALLGPGSAREVMVRRKFDVLLMRVSKWREGCIVEQHRFFDMDLMLRQLGG
jgi:hypothetical protein